MQAEGIQANLKGTQMQVAVGPLVTSTGRGLRENGGGAVSSSFNQHSLGQLKVKMGSCLRWLVGHVWSMTFRPTAFIPIKRERDNVCHKQQTEYQRICSASEVKQLIQSMNNY